MPDSDQSIDQRRGLSRRAVITRGLAGAGVATVAWSNPIIKTVAFAQTNGSPLPGGACQHSDQVDGGCMEACKSVKDSLGGKCGEGFDCNDICLPACHEQEGKGQNECDCANRCNPDCWECKDDTPTFKGCDADCAA